jgi:CubicO group peptidase (beta-lactamase class C family)
MEADRKQIPAEAVIGFVRRLAREDVCLHGFELRQNGAVRAEGYYAPFCKGVPHRMYSVSKSMVSLAVGLLEAEGRLSLDDPIARFFPEYLPQAPDPRLLRMTVGDMLRMATCRPQTAYDEYADRDWTAPFFQKAPTHEPGTVFSYDTSASQALGVLCQRLSGEDLLSFLQRRVFDPAGATDDKRWLRDPSGVPQGGTGLVLSLRDLGKCAQLILDGGRGILPENYLIRATEKQIDTAFQPNPEERYGYGYQFWRTRGGYAMYGMGGQLAIFMPERRIILCTIADTRLDPFAVQRIYDAFYGEIAQAEDAESDVRAEAKLAQALSSLAVAAVPDRPACEAAFAPVYRMETNVMGLRAVRFGEGGDVSLTWDGGETHRFTWGVGRVRQGVFQGEPCLVSGGFYAPGALRVRCHLTGDAPCGMEILLAQGRGRTLTVRLRHSPNPLTNRYEGFAGGEAANG